MTEIILFGGATEGRELAALLRQKGRDILVSVASAYGEALLDAAGPMAVQRGRLNQEEMEVLLRRERPRLVIDATHPYAAEARQNIRAACAARQIPCLRVQRERLAAEGCRCFPDLDSLIQWLNSRPGSIFSALGAQEAAALARVEGFRQRIWLRILPSPEGLAACLNAGFPAQRIICMQGPFSTLLNEAMFRISGAEILLTKESGRSGGFPEKLAAARLCRMTVALLGRPRPDEGLPLAQVKQMIEEGLL